MAKYQESEKTTILTKKLNILIEKIGHAKKDSVILKLQNKINELVENILEEENNVNPMKTYKCKCGYESVYLQNENKNKKCFACHAIIEHKSIVREI